MIKRGWPSTRSATLPGAKPYWNFRDEVSIIQGILFKGEKVIIPMEMRKEMLQIIHNSHLGIEKCKRRARDVLYWPGMSSEIEDLFPLVRSVQSIKEITGRNLSSLMLYPAAHGLKLLQICLNSKASISSSSGLLFQVY